MRGDIIGWRDWWLTQQNVKTTYNNTITGDIRTSPQHLHRLYLNGLLKHWIILLWTILLFWSNRILSRKQVSGFRILRCVLLYPWFQVSYVLCRSQCLLYMLLLDTLFSCLEQNFENIWPATLLQYSMTIRHFRYFCSTDMSRKSVVSKMVISDYQ